MKIGIGNDHAAVDMKNQVVEYLEGKGYEVVNFGTDTYESCNYPEYGEKVGRAVASCNIIGPITSIEIRCLWESAYCKITGLLSSSAVSTIAIPDSREVQLNAPTA